MNNELKDMIMDLKKDDLEEVSRLIRARYDHFTAQESAKYCYGEKVNFNAKGVILKGTITKVNQKSLRIETDEGHRWNVSPCFVSKER